jgi:hypothetical protein
VDCVTQWQVVATVQTISEAHLLPVIEQMLEQFPFEILGFHADNGACGRRSSGRNSTSSISPRSMWPLAGPARLRR